jgi:hypothetical protein
MPKPDLWLRGLVYVELRQGQLEHRFTLSLRDVEDLLAERGVTVWLETIRQRHAPLGPRFTRRGPCHNLFRPGRHLLRGAAIVGC